MQDNFMNEEQKETLRAIIFGLVDYADQNAPGVATYVNDLALFAARNKGDQMGQKYAIALACQLCALGYLATYDQQTLMSDMQSADPLRDNNLVATLMAINARFAAIPGMSELSEHDLELLDNVGAMSIIDAGMRKSFESAEGCYNGLIRRVAIKLGGIGQECDKPVALLTSIATMVPGIIRSPGGADLL